MRWRFSAGTATWQESMTSLQPQDPTESSTTRRVHFLYWGKRGAMSRFTLALANAARSRSDLFSAFSISRANELYEEFTHRGPPLLPVDTFASPLGALGRSYRIPRLRSK